MNTTPLIQVNRLKKYFPVRRGLFSSVVGHVKAVDDISFTIGKGETLGLVGESGCGKTTVGRTILRLIQPTEGSVHFEGEDVRQVRRSRMRQLRRNLQIVFQDPFGSLNPRMTIQGIIQEGLVVHRIGNKQERRELVEHTLQRVGLPPKDYLSRYPHEFSGGQRQRICIARALALNPKFMVLDEPISALDVSYQSQVINLLADLREEFELTYLFISHDLSVVRYISDRVAVMYLGEIVESATSEQLYENPMHPYTQALLSSVPTMVPGKKDRIILEGDVPSPVNPPSGCRFHPRCPKAMAICSQEAPRLLDFDGHTVTCHWVEQNVQVK